MLKKSILMSLGMVLLITFVDTVYGFFVGRVFNMRYAFSANFWVGAIILLSGLFRIMIPAQLLIKKSKLIDHTTYGEKVFAERELKRARGLELIYTGLGIIIITATLQFVLWFI